MVDATEWIFDFLERAMSKVKASGGRAFSKTCLLNGRESEGRKAILVSKRDNTRVAPIGPDGLTLDGSEKVPTSDLVDVRLVVEVSRDSNALVPGVMGDRGTITIPSEIRRHLRLHAGSPVLIEVRGDLIVIHPAEIRPRKAKESRSLEELLEDVTPDNLHGEVSTGGMTGRESW
jgi:antitoxin MazE